MENIYENKILSKLAIDFLKQEFEKNHSINYIVRCARVGDGEYCQVLEDQDYIIDGNKKIDLLYLVDYNKWLAMLQKQYDEEDIVNIDLFNQLANELTPYITYPELFINDFHNW